MTRQFSKTALVRIFLALFMCSAPVLSVATADETVRSSDGTRRFTVRDRGDRYKAIINDRGEKVGYGVKRGDSWTYFVDDDDYSVDKDE